MKAEELDKLAEKYQDDNTIIRYYGPGNGAVPEYNKTMAEVFKDGWNACMEQVMKEAVEAEITKDNRSNNVIRVGLLNNGFEIGDKVRVIVLRKED